MTRAAAAHNLETTSPAISAETLSAAAQGDEAAWRTIIAAYGRRVFALAKSRLADPDAAEEIAQSVFATVAEKLSSGGYSEQGRFEAWLFRVTMNRVRDAARRKRRHAMTGAGASLSHTEAIEPADPAELDRDDTARILGALRQAMMDLPEADREVVELRHHGRMAFRDMADLLGEPMGTLLARHHRALRKLRTAMEDAGIDEQSLDAIGLQNG